MVKGCPRFAAIVAPGEIQSRDLSRGNDGFLTLRNQDRTPSNTQFPFEDLFDPGMLRATSACCSLLGTFRRKLEPLTTAGRAGRHTYHRQRPSANGRECGRDADRDIQRSEERHRRLRQFEGRSRSVGTVTATKGMAWIVAGKLNYREDGEKKGQDPGTFKMHAVPLPK